MNRLAYLNALAIIVLLSTSAFSQSLAQVAKKEKERRAKNTEAAAETKVIGEKELKNAKGDNYSITGESSSRSSDTRGSIRERTASTRAPEVSSATSSTSSKTAVVGDQRYECEAQLRKAEAEKKKLQAQFDEGVVQVATIDTTNPKLPKGEITMPRREMIGRDRNGSAIYGNPGQPEAIIDVEGARVSCTEALQFPSRHPKEARQCSDIKQKIKSSDEEIRRALECLHGK
jgi:type II secretory pathway pseudopilin PulG